MRVAIYCETHNIILDEGEIGSSLLLWNDITVSK